MLPSPRRRPRPRQRCPRGRGRVGRRRARAGACLRRGTPRATRRGKRSGSGKSSWRTQRRKRPRGLAQACPGPRRGSGWACADSVSDRSRLPQGSDHDRAWGHAQGCGRCRERGRERARVRVCGGTPVPTRTPGLRGAGKRRATVQRPATPEHRGSGSRSGSDQPANLRPRWHARRGRGQHPCSCPCRAQAARTGAATRGGACVRGAARAREQERASASGGVGARGGAGEDGSADGLHRPPRMRGTMRSKRLSGADWARSRRRSQ